MLSETQPYGKLVVSIYVFDVAFYITDNHTELTDKLLDFVPAETFTFLPFHENIPPLSGTEERERRGRGQRF